MTNGQKKKIDLLRIFMHNMETNGPSLQRDSLAEQITLSKIISTQLSSAK